MHPIPDEFRRGPFRRSDALAAGLTPRMLRGRRIVRVHPEVYACADHRPTWRDRVAAAALALPPQACTTGLTRIQQLGLDFGPREPLHFVVASTLHLELRNVFLHRTVSMPPQDDEGVTGAAAYVEYCRWARVIDALKVGDWLLHHGHMTLSEVDTLTRDEPWRAGSREARWMLDRLDGAARSLPESELRSLFEAAGLPSPSINVPVEVGGGVIVIGDLVFEAYRAVVEYEGSQHQVDRGQYVADIDRYRLMRESATAYVQVTKEGMRAPQDAVRRVHRMLVRQGYDGPLPDFGADWSLLFARLSQVVRGTVLRLDDPAASA